MASYWRGERVKGGTGIFLNTLLFRPSSLGLALVVSLGLGLSEAVILTTAGLMDGFDKTLREGLRHSGGDISLHSRRGFFPLDNRLEETLRGAYATAVTGLLVSEGLALHGDRVKGVLVRGIEGESFGKTVGLSANPRPGDIVIGSELARFFGVSPGDTLALSLMGGGRDLGDLPTLRSFRIESIRDHGIYEQNLRFVYASRSELQEIMGIGNQVNTVLVKSALEDVDQVVKEMEHSLGDKFSVRPFWSDFSILLRAVRVEKFMIGLILQIIVLIAAFNVMAYMIFLGERGSREIFLFRALGLSRGCVMGAWFSLVLFLWVLSCLFAFVFYQMMKYGIENLPFLALPSEVYHLSNLKLFLSPANYGWVFSLGLGWMVLVTWISFWRMGKGPLIRGLREKFT